MAEDEKNLKREVQSEVPGETPREAARRAARVELQRIIEEDLKNDNGRHSRPLPATVSRSRS